MVRLCKCAGVNIDPEIGQTGHACENGLFEFSEDVFSLRLIWPMI